MRGGERRLAAIMFTDIVGYTSLAQEDEAGTLQLLEDNRSLIRPIFASHGGHEVKTMGDAFLVEFGSALDAVLCAIAIQNVMHDRRVAKGARLSLRIGIHVGDVIESGNDILGDAVNIASRIEPLAEPGGICVSGQAYEQVRNKLPYRLDRVAAAHLKNVNESVEVYRVVLPWEGGRAVAAPSPAFDKHRVAVLPFANISPDPADEYIADGITEELIATMSRIRGLSVIARTSVMGYKGGQKKINEIAEELEVGTVLEGSVRKAGDRLRIMVQLIDSQTGNHRWAESYDREMRDVFAVQSEISKTVATALEVQLLTNERARIEKEPTKDMEAHLLYLKGRYYWNERSETGLRKAIQYFERAIEKDPSYALAYVGIADAYGVLASYELMRMAEGLDKMQWHLQKALELDDNLGEAHAAFGNMLMDRWDWSGAELELKRGIELNPSYATGHHWYSIFLGNVGRLDEALAEIGRARELDPLSLILITATGVMHHYRREYDRAIEWHKKALSMDPDFEPAVFNLAIEYIEASKVEEARALAPMLESKFSNYAPAKPGWASYYAVLGRFDDARKELKEAVAIRSEQYVSAADIAQAYIRLGDAESAFTWLDVACEEKSADLLNLKVDPAYDPIRSDPRFGVLLGRVGLAPG